MAKASIITDLTKHLGIKISNFEKEIGVSNGTLVKAIARESDLQGWVIEKIVQKYPEVSLTWLASGKPPMIQVDGDKIKPFKSVYDCLISNNAIRFSKADMASELDISQEQINQLLESDSVPQTIREKLWMRFDIAPKWLEEGKGPIILDSDDEKRYSQDIWMSKPKEVTPLGKQAYSRLKPDEYSKAFEGWAGVPMYNAPVTASFVELYRDENYYKPSYYLHDPRFKQCNFGAIITGDSMHAEIRHGDHVICQEITDWTFVVFGDIYYIVSKNGLETCKYLNADPRNDNNFLLVPRNENISPSPLPKDMISKMYKVRGVLRGY